MVKAKKAVAKAKKASAKPKKAAKKTPTEEEKKVFALEYKANPEKVGQELVKQLEKTETKQDITWEMQTFLNDINNKKKK